MIHPRVVLAPSTPVDADFILAAESDLETSKFIIPWTRKRHLEAMQDPDCAHLIIKQSESGDGLGFVMLFGVASGDRAIELRRIVSVAKGSGIGRAALRAVKTLAFGRFNAHRLWLDVKSKNQRARHLYRSEGFFEEGVMRECLLEKDGFESLVLMSLLRREQEAFQADLLAKM
jgi:RimJ/RimL family protein N-acetyltransferase